MITSKQTTKAVVVSGFTLLAIGVLGLLMLDGKLASDGADIYENVEKSYCARVAAGTHRHWNTDIDCTIWL